MTLILTSFLAGILTVAAPCILPLLPVVIGGSLYKTSKRPVRRPIVITISLMLSIILFSLLLKASTILLGVPTAVWQVISGAIVALFGLHFLLPTAWERVSVNLKLQSISGGWLSHAGNHSNGYWGDILLGAALGPVFNSCSPTYALIVATILPISFGQGLVALTAYAVGLGSTLLAISLIGQRFIASLGIASNPSGWFRRSLGILFILTGLAVIFGLDKTIQSYVLERGWYDTVADIEHVLQLTQ